MQRAPVKERSHGRWAAILPSLGVSANLLNGKHQPCPKCGGKDRFRYCDRNGTGAFICNKCGAGSGFDLLGLVHGWDFKTAAREVEKIVGDCPAEQFRSERTEFEKREAMTRLWRDAAPVRADDPVGRYLGRRVGLTSFPACLRAARSLRYAPGQNYPAMLAKLLCPDGKPAQVHRTFLSEEGDKAPVDSPRRMMPGAIPKGSAVRLMDAGDVLGIAEGIETALSAAALFGVPCWAALNAEMLKTWEPPDEANEVVIFADNDSSFAGQAAAFTLASRLHGRKSVRIEMPPQIDTDWNDVLRAKGVGQRLVA